MSKQLSLLQITWLVVVGLLVIPVSSNTQAPGHQTQFAIVCKPNQDCLPLPRMRSPV
ncbi:MAG TPA: hypothetical protein V6C78_06800 [Crinalium sp.]|jgi:hypothetical protein